MDYLGICGLGYFEVSKIRNIKIKELEFLLFYFYFLGFLGEGGRLRWEFGMFGFLVGYRFVIVLFFDFFGFYFFCFIGVGFI